MRLKAAVSEKSISDVVNDAVRRTLSEDAADLEAFGKRRREPNLDFEDVALKLKRSASYKVLIKKSAAKELEQIAGKKDRQRIAERIRALAENPRPHGVEKLAGSSEKYRIRQGDFRILYEIRDDVLIVFVVPFADRKEAYRKGTG